jgi:nickel-dependent lactate racemase
MILYSSGSERHDLTAADIREGLNRALDRMGDPSRILIIPPDITRYHSRAGEITRMVFDRYGGGVTDILPALGTHKAMTEAEMDLMFPGVPHHLFRVHDWRHDVLRIGEVPGTFISEVTGGALSYSWPAEINRLVYEGGHDLVLSVGQVVPHEVIGMANYNKNLLIGCGGPEGINKSHFLGAVYGMERLMGIADNPVRQVLNYASREFLSHLPVLYILTVQAPVANDPEGRMVTRGLFIGTGEEVFLEAAALSQKVNHTDVGKPLSKVVVYLDPGEYRSTWLGNKAIYRTRMAIADGGELIVLAPGVREFGEDPEIDRLIRKYGYHGTPATLDAVNKSAELRNNLSAAAHLIHGSSEGRFRITYCPGGLSRKEVEDAGFGYLDPEEGLKTWPPDRVSEGFNLTADGVSFFFIRNPATGLWTAGQTGRY